MKLALFLSEKDITFVWLVDIIYNLTHIPIEDFIRTQYCELEHNCIFLYNREYCEGNRYCNCV